MDTIADVGRRDARRGWRRSPATDVLWQMDFKGWIRLANGRRSHPLTVIDGSVKCPHGLALFKAMLLAMWYDLSDVKLSEALDDRSSRFKCQI